MMVPADRNIAANSKADLAAPAITGVGS